MARAWPSPASPPQPPPPTWPCRPRPTHFVALQLSHSPAVRAAMHTVQAALLAHDAQLGGTLIEPSTAHVTVSVVRLDGDGQVAAAARCLAGMWARLRQLQLLGPLQLRLGGLGSFRDQVGCCGCCGCCRPLPRGSPLPLDASPPPAPPPGPPLPGASAWPSLTVAASPASPRRRPPPCCAGAVPRGAPRRRARVAAAAGGRGAAGLWCRGAAAGGRQAVPAPRHRSQDGPPQGRRWVAGAARACCRMDERAPPLLALADGCAQAAGCPSRCRPHLCRRQPPQDTAGLQSTARPSPQAANPQPS
jgi:hypothetical protein